MLSDIRGGFSLAARRWKFSLATAFIFAAVGLVMSLIVGGVLTEAEALRGGTNLRQAHAVVFTPVYPPGAVSEANDDTVTLLSDHVSSGDAYSAVINNLALDEPDAFGETPTMLVAGDAAFEMFPSLGPGCQAPCVLRGALQSPSAGSVVYRGVEFSDGGILPQGAVWFDANAAGLNLDEYQVLVLDAQHLVALDDFEREELLTKAVLLAPSPDVLGRYIEAAKDGGLYLVPSDVADDHDARLSSLMTRAALEVMALAAFGAVALFAYGAVIREIVREESRAFVIRRLCGASTERLAVRMLVFLALTTLVCPLVVCLALRLAGPPVESGATVIALMIVLIYLALAASALRSVRKEGDLA